MQRQIMRRVDFVSIQAIVVGVLASFQRLSLTHTLATDSQRMSPAHFLKKTSSVVALDVNANHRQNAIKRRKNFVPMLTRSRARESRRPVGRASKAMPRTGSSAVEHGKTATYLEKLRTGQALLRTNQCVVATLSAGTTDSSVCLLRKHLHKRRSSPSIVRRLMSDAA